MAPECLEEDDFTIKNDVFAFSIVVWELFTQALKIPFEDMTNEEYLNKAQSSTLEWKVAENTPEELKTILVSLTIFLNILQSKTHTAKGGSKG